MMKHRILHLIRDGFITLCSMSGAVYLYRALRKNRGPLVRIVVFHDVPSGPWFAEMIETLTTNFHVITPEDFINKNLSQSEINVLVTFDDGYQSWVDVALPVLQRYGVQALFFISSGLLDTAEDTEARSAFMRESLMIRPRPALTWDGARALHLAGHTLGGHARTHANLALQDAEALKREVYEDHARIESVLSITLTEFAYPFGTSAHVNEAAVEAVRGAGYARGYTAISRFVPTGETFLIPRMCIEIGTSPQALKRLVRGAYDLFDMLKSLCAR